MRTSFHVTWMATGIFGCLLAMACGPAYGGEAGRNYYDAETVDQAREKVARHDWAQTKQREMENRVGWMLEMSDRELWDFVPPVDQLRALNVAFNVGCPVHGQEVYREGGAYPWIMSREKPFKVECPVGGEVYPTNDFIPWDHEGREGEIDTTREYVDDGSGYVGPEGQTYYFVAHYIFWQRWREDILPRLDDLGELYLLTGDKNYARTAAVLLARIASEYPESDYQAQSVHRERPHKIRGGILDYIWENGAVVNTSATAFDAISPVLDDPEVVGFIRHEKGVGDVGELIEDRLLFELVNRITRGRDGQHENRIWGNFGMYQRSLAILAVVLDNDDPDRGMTSDEMVEWIMRPGPWHEVGAVREALWNRFYRDGHGGESSPGYSSGWANSISSVARVLAKLDYNLYEHPKMRRLVDVWLDMAVLGEWTPSIGDSGSIFGSRRRGWYRNILLPAYEALGEPRWAKALEMIGVRDNELWENVPMESIREDADAYGDWPTGGVRLLGGYGLGIAESPSAPVGLSLYYGYAGGGHGHRDRLGIEMFALGQPILPQHGYPTPLGSMTTAPKRFLWTSNTIAQYGVTVNRQWQQTVKRGRLNTLASLGGFQVVDASANDAAYPDDASLYRRTSVLVENSDGLPYLFDLFRVSGGWEHVWSFHGPPFEDFSTFGLDLEEQEAGTLAGEDVDFGEDPTDSITDRTSGFQYLFNVRRAPPPSAPWGATWSRADDSGHVRMTALPSAATEIVVADAEPELNPDHPETMPYLLAFNGSGDPASGVETRSEFVAVVEPYEENASLGEMRRLPRDGAAQGVAVSVQRASGVDTIVSHLSSGESSSVQLGEGANEPLFFAGELAHVSTDGDELTRVSLVNGRSLKSPWLDVDVTGSLRGEIERVDYEKNLIVLDRRIPGDKAIVGQTVTVGNDRHSTAFRIDAVDRIDGATALRFGDVPMFVGMAQVQEVGDSSITTRTEFGQWQADGGEHSGRRLLDSGLERTFLIRDIDESTFQLEAGDVELHELFSEDEADERNRFWIAETGPGDRWKIPSLFSLERSGNDAESFEYALNLNSRARLALRLPELGGRFWGYMDIDGEWQRLPVSVSGEKFSFELTPEQIREGQTILRPGNSSK